MWFLSVQSLHSVGKCGPLGAPNPVLQRGARALHLSPRKMEERMKERRHGPHMPGLKTCFFYRGHRLPHPLPTWQESSYRHPLSPTPDCGKHRREADPLHCPHLGHSALPQRFLSTLPALGAAALAGPRHPAGGWLAVRASRVRPTFPSPPGALGARRHSRAGSGTDLLLGAPGDQSSLLCLFPQRC